MSAKSFRRFLPPIALPIFISGCSVLDQLELGSTRTYDPTKVYLKDEDFTLRKHDDMDRYVCLSGPLRCDGFGQTWDCFRSNGVAGTICRSQSGPEHR